MDAVTEEIPAGIDNQETYRIRCWVPEDERENEKIRQRVESDEEKLYIIAGWTAFSCPICCSAEYLFFRKAGENLAPSVLSMTGGNGDCRNAGVCILGKWPSETIRICMDSRPASVADTADLGNAGPVPERRKGMARSYEHQMEFCT